MTENQNELIAKSDETPDSANTATIDITQPGVAKVIAKRMLDDIEAYAQKTYDTGPRSHLGGSLIGDDCLQKLWLHFRWVKHEKFPGRILRLFQRGHREEATFIEYLRGIGCQVWEFDDENASEEDKGKKQFRISGSGGHFGGSLDGIIKLPPHYGIDEAMLAEFKTNGTGAGFNKLGDSGLVLAKPMHFAQTCTYGFAYGFRFVVYLNVNKNDDSLHIEIVPLNLRLGESQFKKAERVITSQEPMPKISASPAAKQCGGCNYKNVCHNGELPEKNCRSCKFARPIDNAQWQCDKWSAVIPSEDDIKAGCPEWFPIINGKE
uniref:Exonuclease n=1 Tax=Pseudomonas phage Pavpe01 TaxID=3138545 RepID=A0AAU6W086_9VIRU